MSQSNPQNPANVGDLSGITWYESVVNGAGVALEVGTLVAFELSASATTATALTNAEVLFRVRRPNATFGLDRGIYGIVTERMDDVIGAPGRVCIRGVVQALVASSDNSARDTNIGGDPIRGVTLWPGNDATTAAVTYLNIIGPSGGAAAHTATSEEAGRPALGILLDVPVLESLNSGAAATPTLLSVLFDGWAIGRTSISKATAVANLVTSVGTGDGTIADVGDSFSQATLNNNFKDIADQFNDLLVALRSNGTLKV